MVIGSYFGLPSLLSMFHFTQRGLLGNHIFQVSGKGRKLKINGLSIARDTIVTSKRGYYASTIAWAVRRYLEIFRNVYRKGQ